MKSSWAMMINSICKYTASAVIALFCAVMADCTVFACNYNEITGTFTCSENKACDDEALSYAKRIVVKGALSKEGIEKLLENDNILKIDIGDMSNFDEKELEALYPVLSKGNPAMAAIMFSYENYKDSFGNDGTKLYRKVMSENCSEITYLRSCASVVSGAIDAAGYADYASAATAGLVDYFEASPRWLNLGRLKESQVRPGDVIFIDRKSHQKQYESGEMHDSESDAEVEYVYKGGYDSTGHKNYETQDPTGAAEEVFCPDQDGDGEVNDWEAEYWRCYWERVRPGQETPPYDYYYTWKEEARTAKELKKEQEKQQKESEEESKPASKTKKKIVVHDHIFIWTGNDLIKRFYPKSKGNIVSGSYTEKYQNARSAAISKYDFTGDYRVYRYVKP